MNHKKELDKLLHDAFLKQESKSEHKVFKKKSVDKQNDIYKQSIKEQVDKDNIIEELKEIFDWYASETNTPIKYKHGITSKWGNWETAYLHFPEDRTLKHFRFYAVLDKRWIRNGLRRRYWVRIDLGNDKYKEGNRYSIHSSDRCMDTRWTIRDNKMSLAKSNIGNNNIFRGDYFSDNTFKDKRSLLKFVKSRLINKISSSYGGINFWDTYKLDNIKYDTD